MDTTAIARAREQRARAIADAGGLEHAIACGALGRRIDTTLAEALVLGLLRQGVATFLTVLGHGSTEVGEVLRIYQGAGLLRTCGLRSEIEASHAAMALRWVSGEKAAVVTSIGPGALQAVAASLAPASDGVGVWYLLGDESSEDEGPNMQQIPKHEQQSFLRVCAAVGEAYSLHTPGALPAALRRGLLATDHPYRAGPFFVLMPLNTQPQAIAAFNLDELPCAQVPGPAVSTDEAAMAEAVEALSAAERVVVKVGGGGRGLGGALDEFLELADAVAVLSPGASGVIAHGHRRNMLVGGSKGTLCGNFAMEEADLLVAIGSRFVCQSDCSRTGYPKVKRVVNINADPRAAMHYNKTVALVGDARETLTLLNARLARVAAAPTLQALAPPAGSPSDAAKPELARPLGGGDCAGAEPLGSAGPPPVSQWLAQCRQKREQWDAHARERYSKATLYDARWGREVLTQPAAIKLATDWARANEVVTFFDAGDVQANGFQIVEDDRVGRTFTETGASYMGFAVSALLATALARKPFYAIALSGDGSFTMNPQILIDGVEHGARGCIVLLDNRRMGAISSLQRAQYGADHATCDAVEVDYVALAAAVRGVNSLSAGDSPAGLTAALDRARAYQGLSLVHVPVYFGDDPLGGMGVFGRWNVGNWVADTQAMRHDIGL